MISPHVHSWLSGVVLWMTSSALDEVEQAQQRFQLDPVEHYGSRVLTAILVFGILLILYNLIRYRGSVPGPLAWGLLILGGAVVPVLSLSFGTVLVFEKAEKVEFCASCHLAMKSYVDDMRDPKSESLAAIHYKNIYISSNQCYTCHTSYGMFGTAEAKLSGVVDLYKYYMHTFHLPIKMRGPYPNGDCLKCHAGSVKWPVIHADVKDGLYKGDLACLDCHRDTHPAHTLAPVRPQARMRRTNQVVPW